MNARIRSNQILLKKSFVLKTGEGKLCRNYKHLDPLVKGEKIAVYDSGEFLYAPEDGFILLPNLQAPVNTEWYYLGTAKKVA